MSVSHAKLHSYSNAVGTDDDERLMNDYICFNSFNRFVIVVAVVG